ncbi:hypothetical protein LTR95_016445 [Oleoguttula sp. CCFEE 5521]
MKLLGCVISVFAWAVTALANTEKVIFVAPPSIGLSDDSLSLAALQLSTITPEKSTLRTDIKVDFPTQDSPSGRDHWYLLRTLNAGQRYELRVCWAAVQPTAFQIDSYEIAKVFDTPDLIQRLALYAERPDRRTQNTTVAPSADGKESLLFLRVQAAADFFTTNKTRMLDPPLADIDLILDPYLWNVFPQSLGPTAAYIVVLAIGGWFASGRVWRHLVSSEPIKDRRD